MAFNGRFIVNIAQFASSQGADMMALLDVTGLGIAELCRDECSVSSQVYNDVLAEAIRQTRDQLFGLHAGENLNLSAAGLIAQISASSDTVKQALEYCCEFANLGCSSLPMAMRKQGSEYVVTLTPEPVWGAQWKEAVRHTAEGYLAFTIREYHTLTLLKQYPMAIHVPWSPPENTSEYERVFQCPVVFNQDKIAVIFSAAQVESKVITSDFELLRILIDHAQRKSEALSSQRDYASVVKNSIIKLIKPEFPTIEQVAGHLNISVRSLQRKLQEEGLTYKSLVDDLRQDFAKQYLRRDDLQINEIAYLLDYSDPSAFVRSFKRWTGQTPKEFRVQNSEFRVQKD